MSKPLDILRTLSARCRDCYRCVRVCPVKAIGVHDNQAWVDPERCILCGTCVKECPQHAKVYRDDTDVAAEIVAEGRAVASVAPSFAAVYGGWRALRLPSALRKLGFLAVAETSEGAEIISREAAELCSRPDNTANVCTACPAVVSFVEKYHPEHLGSLLPVVSPMIAHARAIKAHWGEGTRVVFIGPCLAKKREAERPEYQGDVEAVLTFEELDRWLEREGIRLEDCAESGFDNQGRIPTAKIFPLPGGMIRTLGLSADATQKEILHTSGMENVRALFASPDSVCDLHIVEPLFCQDGCLGGPATGSPETVFHRRANLLAYCSQRSALPEPEDLPQADFPLQTQFAASELDLPAVSDEQILEVYEQTEKLDPAAQLNCGACGYGSCREMATAVVRGMASSEMCVPYTRRLAERRTDKIIQTSPNGIVTLDEDLKILSMNPSFRTYFTCNDAVLGRRISYLADASAYEKLQTGSAERVDAVVSCYGKQFHLIAYRMPEDRQLVGIYTDVTGLQLTRARLDSIKQQTVMQARELLEHQIQMAQTMARFLGDSTARGEELVERLMSIHDQ